MKILVLGIFNEQRILEPYLTTHNVLTTHNAKGKVGCPQKSSTVALTFTLHEFLYVAIPRSWVWLRQVHLVKEEVGDQVVLCIPSNIDHLEERLQWGKDPN